MLRAGMPDARPNSWCLSTRQTFWLLFLGGALRALWQFQSGHFGPGYEMVAVARTLAATGQFANPFQIYPTGPTAIVPPLYPAFLALLIHIFGFSRLFVLVIYGTTAAVHGLHAALLPPVSKVLFHDRRPGLWAAALMIVFPLYDFLPQFETSSFAVGLLLFCMLDRGAVVTGLAAGLLALLNPASVFVTIPWTLYRLRRGARTHACSAGTLAGARFLLISAATAAVVLLPWTIRNYRQFHSLFFVRNNFGLELRLANNDLAYPTFRRNMSADRYEVLHPGGSLAEARRMSGLGEPEYNRQQLHTAIDWIRNHPRRFLSLTIARVRMFWFPDPEDGPARSAGIVLATLLSAGGLWLMVRRRQPIAFFLAPVWLVFPLLYYVNQADPHYRTPILWMTTLTAGYFLTATVPAISRAMVHFRSTRADSPLAPAIRDRQRSSL